jgi:hypothetical protein
MVPTYEARMDRLLADTTWRVKKLDFPSELAFLLSRT